MVEIRFSLTSELQHSPLFVVGGGKERFQDVLKEGDVVPRKV